MLVGVVVVEAHAAQREARLWHAVEEQRAAVVLRGGVVSAVSALSF